MATPTTIGTLLFLIGSLIHMSMSARDALADPSPDSVAALAGNVCFVVGCVFYWKAEHDGAPKQD